MPNISNQLQNQIRKNAGLCVSTDTLRTEDLLATFSTLADYYGLRLPPEDMSEQEAVDYYFDHFDEISPHGYYFGAQEGDGACFGWWR